MYALFLLICWQPQADGAKVVFGAQQSAFQVQGYTKKFQLPTYQNNGFSQNTWRQDGHSHAQVSVHTKPLASKAKARIIEALPAKLKPLQDQLNKNHGGLLADQVAILIDWMTQNIAVEHHYDANQSLDRVLSSRSANCVGLANFATMVLTKLDINVRQVTGVVFQPTDAARRKMQGPVLHRWIEIQYPDIGWVFADPGGKVNHIEARYLVLGIHGYHPVHTWLQALQGGQIELLYLRNGFQTIAHLHGLAAGLRVRSNQLFYSP